jgi:predicted nucleic acid-binding protein
MSTPQIVIDTNVFISAQRSRLAQRPSYVKAQCGYLVTYNQRDFEGSEEFGIAVVTPGQLLHEIGVIP